MSQVFFGGQPVSLTDPDGRYQQWLDDYQSLRDRRLFAGAPVAYTEGRLRPRGAFLGQTNSSSTINVGLPQFNWTDPPRLKLNTLWWPATGACRWAFALLLMHDTDLKNVINNISFDDVTHALLIKDGKNTLDLRFFMLEPFRANNVGDDDGWLVPIVDQRYFWQFKDVGDLAPTSSTSWATLFSSIATAMNVGITVDSVPAGYGNPDPIEFTRRYENAAAVLDAAAASVGMRVCYTLDHEVLVRKPSNWLADLNANFGGAGKPEEGFTLLAGGQSSEQLNPFGAGADVPLTRSSWGGGMVPATCRVVFQKYEDDGPLGGGAVHKVDEAASGHTTLPSVVDTVKTFYTTAHADFTGGSIQNGTEVNNLADQIASDYYAGLGYLYDVTFQGLKKWTCSGFDDWLWFHFGSQNERGKHEAFTRIASQPQNFGCSEQCQQFSTYDPDFQAELVMGQADGAVATSDATFTADNLTVLLPKGASVGASITVQNTFDDEIDDNGTVIAAYNHEDDQWECLAAVCPV